MSIQGAPYDGAPSQVPLGFGRVALVPPPAFALMEQSRLRREATPYSTALRGDKCSNELSRIYFGASNVARLNAQISRDAQVPAGFATGLQDQDALTMLMRDVFLEFALNRDDQVHKQVDQLNAIVVQRGAKTIIESAAAGVPAVDIGPRQAGRLTCGSSVVHCRYGTRAVKQALGKALKMRLRGRLANVYGDGTAGRRIVRILAATALSENQRRKRIAY